MKQKLESFGFEVQSAYDADRMAMVSALTWYKKKSSLRNVDICVFYYAGHAVSIGLENYLLPIGSENADEHEIKFMAIQEQDVIRELTELNTKSIVILDACRNPFGSYQSRGSARGGLNATTGSKNFLIAYSTAPNTTAADGNGRNSPFTKHLIKNMKPGIKIQDIFIATREDVHDETDGKQIPWSHDSLLGKIYFDS